MSKDEKSEKPDKRLNEAGRIPDDPDDFTEELGQKFLDLVRSGLTIREACRKPGMPNYLTIYDWFRDHKLKIGKSTFESKYREAIEDRNQTWLDEAILGLKGMTVNGSREDAARLRKAEMMANLYMKVATQGKQLLKVQTDSGDNSITLNIQTFGTPEEDKI